MVTVSTRRSTRALSVDVALIRLLAKGATRARVHSVFRHVINVVTPAGQLISLCGRDHDDAPWSLRADVDVWTAWAVQAGDEVHVVRDGFTLPTGRVSLTGAQAWDAAATPITANPTQLTARARELASVIRAAGVPGGALSGPSPDPFDALVGEQAHELHGPHLALAPQCLALISYDNARGVLQRAAETVGGAPLAH